MIKFMIFQCYLDILFSKLEEKIRERLVQNRKSSCNCKENHRYFVGISKNCRLNLPENGRKFFHGMKCECHRFAKGAFCPFCSIIRNVLSTYVQKICLPDEDFLCWDFERKPLQQILNENLLVVPILVF